jgi:hypothetical protein
LARWCPWVEAHNLAVLRMNSLFTVLHRVSIQL